MDTDWNTNSASICGPEIIGSDDGRHQRHPGFFETEAGKLDLEKIEFSLKDCGEKLSKQIASRAHEKGLEISSDIRRRCPTAILGDPGRLRQIILNLVGNAIKFTDHGEVVVYAEPGNTSEKRMSAALPGGR